MPTINSSVLRGLYVILDPEVAGGRSVEEIARLAT